MNHLLQQWLDSTTIDALGWTLAHFVWQGCLVGLILACALSVMRRAAASTRYLASCAAMLAMATLPIATFVVIAHQVAPVRITAQTSMLSAGTAIFQPSNRMDDGGSARQGNVSEHNGTTRPQSSASPNVSVAQPNRSRSFVERFTALMPWLVSLWLVGVVVLWTRLTIGWTRLQSIKHQAGAPPAGWTDRLIAVARRVGVSRPVRLLSAIRVDVPCTMGWIKPIILIPAGALAGLTPDQLDALLAHELAHIRRYDYLVNLAQSAIESLLFYHPAAWWVSRQIRLERENCCDDIAVEACGNKVIYARALATMEELRVLPPCLAAAATGGPLLSRIRRLLGTPATNPPAPWWPMGTIVLVALLSAGIAIRLAHAEPKPAPQATTRPTTVPSAEVTPISGRVLTAGGAPADGATVNAFLLAQGAAHPIGSARSQPDGRFELAAPSSDANAAVELVITSDKLGMASYRARLGRFPADIRLSEPAELQLTFVDLQNLPISNLRVSLGGPPGLGGFDGGRFPYAGMPKQTWTTDSGGRCRIGPVPLGTPVVVLIDDERYAQLLFREGYISVTGRVTETGPIQLAPPSSISGRITLGNGGPPAAELPLEVHWVEGGGALAGRAVTNASGEYQFDRLPPGTYDVFANPHGDLAKSWLITGKGPIAVGLSQKVSGQDVALAPGATIVGRVTQRARGARGSGSSVRANAITPDGKSSGATVDASGNYTIHVPPGTYHVSVTPGRYQQGQPPEATIQVEAAKTYTADFVMAPKAGAESQPTGASITGLVLDEAGKPAQNAFVDLTPAPGQSTGWARARTNDAGGFVFRNVTGPRLLRAGILENRSASAQPVPVTPGQDVTVHLSTNILPILKGRVIDEGGHPMAGIAVAAGREISPGTFGMSSTERSKTDADGRYSVTLMLRDGRYHLRASRAIGYASRESGVLDNFKPGEVRELPDLVLPKADHWVSGRVVDGQGKPVEGARVRIRDDLDYIEGFTGADGRFRLNNFAEPQFELIASGGSGLVGPPNMMWTATLHAKAETSDNVLTLTLQPVPRRGPATAPSGGN